MTNNIFMEEQTRIWDPGCSLRGNSHVPISLESEFLTLGIVELFRYINQGFLNFWRKMTRLVKKKKIMSSLCSEKEPGEVSSGI